MGTSTDAILFYGFCWDEEDVLLWNEDEDSDDWEKRYVRLKGLVAPTEPYPDRVDRVTGKLIASYTPEEQAIIDKYHEHWDVRDKLLLDELNVEIDSHCSGECPMPFIYIRASKTVSRRGYPTMLTSAWLDVDATWDEELRAFCEFMGIDVRDKQIGWWLVSNWD